jgi:ADP-ribosylglycohydrolase
MVSADKPERKRAAEGFSRCLIDSLADHAGTMRTINGRCFDIGITMRSALSRFVADRDALASGDASERASGNGSIMRLAPVPVGHADLYPDHVGELSRLADESSLPTHASGLRCAGPVAGRTPDMVCLGRKGR